MMKVLIVNIYLRSSFSLRDSDFGKELVKNYRLVLQLRLHPNIKSALNLVSKIQRKIIQFTENNNLRCVYYLNRVKLNICLTSVNFLKKS